MPRARLVAGGERGGEAVQREDQRGRCLLQQFGQRIVIGIEKPRDPRLALAVVAGNGMAVTDQRDEAGAVRIAVEIADEAADVALERGETRLPRHQRADLRHADVYGDVLGEQFGRDAEVDIGRNGVAGVVRDDQNAAGDWGAENAIGLFSLKPLPLRGGVGVGSVRLKRIAELK